MRMGSKVEMMVMVHDEAGNTDFREIITSHRTGTRDSGKRMDSPIQIVTRYYDFQKASQSLSSTWSVSQGPLCTNTPGEDPSYERVA